jgi:hypothetical protein
VTELPATPERTLPRLYGRWLDALLGAPVAVESKATCGACPMSPAEGAPTRRQPFDGRLKCCTYFPILPNYLVGAALAEAACGHPLLALVRGERPGEATVSPLGVSPSTRYGLLYAHGLPGFGTDAGLRCPYLVEAGEGSGGTACSIWPHRQSACATWYCRFERGRSGSAFWTQAYQLLSRIEEALRWWCVLAEGFAPDTLRALAYAQHGATGETDAASIPAGGPGAWGERWGQAEAFYGACARRVASLSWDDVRRLGGPEVDLHGRLLADAHAALAAPLPERLRLREFSVIAAGPAGAEVVSHSRYDPLLLPPSLLPHLHVFRGQPAAEALAELAEAGLALPPEGLRALVDYGVLEG